MSQDSKVDQIIYSMEVIKQQLEEIEGQEQSLSMILQDLMTTIEFVRNISKAEGVSLIPIGRGLYVEAEVKNRERVLVDIGASTYKKTGVEDALAVLNDRLNEVSSALESARNTETSLQKRYTQLEDYINRVYKK